MAERVTIDVFGAEYPIRSSLDPEYVKRLAQYVDRRMYAVADQMGGGDRVHVAVLTALNIADDYFRLREARAGGHDAQRLTTDIEQLIDTALGDPPAAAAPPEQPQQPDQHEQPERPAQPEQPDHPEQSEQSEQPEQSAQSEQPEPSEQPE